MEELKIYFSDFFDVEEDIIESYGAVNISLINDMPLFVDPFLLFNSEKPEYQQIHAEIIRYLLFLQQQAGNYDTPPKGMLSSWYLFSEVKQTWLGFSLDGNGGRGLGKDFAENLFLGLKTIFREFGKEQIEILKTMKGKVAQKELDSIYVVLDISPLSGDEDSQLNQLVKILETRRKYDGSRLR